MSVFRSQLHVLSAAVASVRNRALSSRVIVATRPLLLVAMLVAGGSPAWGNDDDLQVLELFNGAPVESVFATRSPRPISEIADNVTVITAKDIAALNAHTLTDVLSAVPGVHFQKLRTPGAITIFGVQGSDFRQILVLVDNVPVNTLGDNVADVSSIPVQLIERVEIVKGAASSSWGNALGGVINLITKTPRSESAFSGDLSASLGSRGTADGRAAVSGTVGRLGYYLSGGKIYSDGLLENNQVDLSTLYGKLLYDLGEGTLAVSTGYSGNDSGQVAYLPFNLKADQSLRQLFSTLSLQYRIGERVEFQAAVRSRLAGQDFTNRWLDTNLIRRQINSKESANGATFNLFWRGENQKVGIGMDYDHLWLHQSAPLLHTDLLNRRTDRYGVYLNDTISLNRFAITPSVRFDRTGTDGDFFSPSFGVTYLLTEQTLLRGYTSRGYGLRSVLFNDDTEKVWASQVGFESGSIPYLWLKGSIFRNETWNIDATDPATGAPVKERWLKHGVEIELRTLPVLSTSFSAGYTYIDTRNSETEEVVHGIPRQILKLGLNYDDCRGLRALLTGNYINWNNAESGGRNGILWDLHLGKKVLTSDRLEIEIFGSVRNIFNAEQHLDQYYKNPGRWFEGGARCSF